MFQRRDPCLQAAEGRSTTNPIEDTTVRLGRKIDHPAYVL